MEIMNETLQLLIDGGVENYNTAVSNVVESGMSIQLLARTETSCFTPMIESWWRVLKHQWLCLNTLDSAVSLRRLVTFYVDQHSRHSALHGQTPDEIYTGTGEQIPTQLEVARLTAQQSRLKGNRECSCDVCHQSTPTSCRFLSKDLRIA